MFVFGVQVKVGVRIHPLDFGDGPLERDGLLGIEFGIERVMAEGRSDAPKHTKTHRNDQIERTAFHRAPPVSYRDLSVGESSGYWPSFPMSIAPQQGVEPKSCKMVIMRKLEKADIAFLSGNARTIVISLAPNKSATRSG
jgi:hypothetical protein